MRSAPSDGLRAIVVGAAGQDGHYLTRHLMELGYHVCGVERDTGPSLGLHSCNILDPRAVMDLVAAELPDEIYYLAAYHHSSQEEQGTLRELFDASYNVHCAGLLNFLNAIVMLDRPARLFYAASALIFGNPGHAPQDEDTPIAPVCVYGITKATGKAMCNFYRRDKGIYCCAGILYNHESPRRGLRFVTRKIVRAAVEIHRGERSSLTLGMLDAQVDWSYAGDVVRAMHAMLRLDEPRDFVIASGTLHTVRDFAERAFAVIGLDYRNHVVEDPLILHRANRLHPLHGNAGRLRVASDWQPQVSFDRLVEMMVLAEFDVRHAP